MRLRASFVVACKEIERVIQILPEDMEQRDSFCDKLKELGIKRVEKGIFGADMKVALINDGPVTIWIDSRNRE